MKTETIKRMFEIDFGTMMGTANDTTLIKEKKQMNNTQQIEEIARILCGADNNYDYDCQHCTLLTSCASMENAVRLYNEGYRKLNSNIDFYTIKKEYNDYMGYDDYVVITPTIDYHRFHTKAEAEKFVSSLKHKNDR